MAGANWQLRVPAGRLCKELKQLRRNVRRNEEALARIPADDTAQRAIYAERIARGKRELAAFEAFAKRWHDRNPGHTWTDPRSFRSK